MLKEIKEDLNKGKDITGSWMGRLNIVKMARFPIAIYRFNAIHIKILKAFFCRNRKADPKIQIELKRTLNWQNNFEKEKVGALTLPHFKTYYQATVIKNCGASIRTDI